MFPRSSPALLGGSNSGSLPVVVTVAVFLSIALYNSIELLVMISLSFTSHRGVYFWSLLLSTAAGVIPFTISNLFDFFGIPPLWLTLLLSSIGFSFMIPGQSVVLYSRLHLVSHNYKILRALRYLIIIDTIILVTPTIVLYWGSVYISTKQWTQAFHIHEQVQIAWFSAQEFLISSFYIIETVKLIRAHPGTGRRPTIILYELLAINLVAILLDIALLALQYSRLYYIQVIFKALVYSVKLKLEFAVLGRLVSFVGLCHATTVDRVYPSFITTVDMVPASINENR